MYKKHMVANYTYPVDSEYNTGMMCHDNSQTCQLKLRLQPMYIRRLFATKAFILRIEKVFDDDFERKDIPRPNL